MSNLRKILFPFAALYGAGMSLRNYLYEEGILKSTSYSFPVICVGNLSMGGTGKTPMIEYLLTLLSPNYKTAVLSRGYGRDSSGFLLLDGSETAQQVGDEPLQFKLKFKNSCIAVDEKRTRGISLLQQNCNPEVVLLDDAFQHRKVKAGFNILLTSYGKLYTSDVMLPAGNLREPVAGVERAHIIVVTKCPQKITLEAQKQIRKKLKLKEYQQLYFSYIEYSERIFNEHKQELITSMVDEKITLVTGIADPKPLCEYLETLQIDYEHLNFPDHHSFTNAEITKIAKASRVLTTEKDFMRLKSSVDHPNLFYIPIKMKFKSKGLEFDQQIETFVHEK